MPPLSALILAAFFTLTGLGHLLKPQPFLRIMPRWVPWPRAVNAFVGLAELGAAVGLCVPSLRPAAIVGIELLLLGVLPANWRMLRDREASFGIAPWILWLRLPLQFVLMAWVWSLWEI